ncbi:glycosyltransferase family 2 protein [Helicobacter bilis]|uniref:Glycosyltransferase n=1 Tax=Helicobacter bilis TaxID=37372 RepID=A0A4U8U6G0_9HELI|nr:glycosyltransferase [Helicobacter bilis]MCI7411051.1 glycosyltransferase [Helicobacter bilis]MDD7296740.1 glycosyltransferase [Helicobacter bilis]MDY4400867.1 glycosyltransferase [Helicobacter bilis]TLE07720.1 glycosyltransferase [Helicobacter bilis]TLE09409.1 glycosyltransferase [Helicobacter bilis]
MKLPQVEIIISLYNYAEYISECILSVIKQDYPHILIHVVDDGSSDDSVRIVQDYCRQYANIRLTTKANGGQLSAFNAGFIHLDGKSEIVFFLDADDYMREGYIKKAVETFLESQCDMLFCDLFIMQDGKISDGDNEVLPYGDLGFSIFDTYFNGSYYGHSTSTIAITKQMLSRILPLSLENEWRIRADDCIIYGAALVGAKIFHLDFKGIYYRVHSNNNHCGKTFSSKYEFHRALSVQKLFSTLLERHKISLHYSLFCAEIDSKPSDLLYRYKKMIRATDFKYFQKWRAYKILRKKLKRI